ncbi:magnesium and cobalt transport protein CorA [Cellulosimicrobium arenosum]|uniref:Magnesium and cobalt transport protein CorA n=1 Tax=Cellulosimicrobium arenosum TaxID=2708133 RepID=A0A927J1W8_9MICO|nr:magnesium and cobalt transport protein CorA [Cellulosimicrobium arenosum]MBD8080414.1 magnesium and cobalt transport protein CorA [Cellulosimicrobium arenosum]
MSARRTEGPPARRRDLLRRRPAGEPETVDLPRIMRYVDAGRVLRAPDEDSVADGLRFAAAAPDHMTMLLYPAPDAAAVQELAQAWDLHPVLVDDLLHAHQRPKLERYGDVLFLVVRSARYVDELEEVDFSEFHVLVRPGAIAILCQDARWIDGTAGAALEESIADVLARGDRSLLTEEHLLNQGPEAVVYRVLDTIVDGYAPVLRGIDIDKEQIERQVFSGDAAVAERIYRLSQEVIDTQHVTSSMISVVRSLSEGFGKYDVPQELQTFLQDVSDHLARAHAQVSEYRDALAQILDVNATLVAQRQNEDMKKISGWAAILFAPTLVAAIYGMNFDVMPELHWTLGYPSAVVAMVGFAGALYWIFKRRKWM